MTAIVYIRRLTALLVSNLILLMLLGCGGSGDDGNGAAGHSSRLALTLTTAGETLNSRQLGSVSTARAEPGDQDFVTLIKIIVSADDIDPPIIEFFEVPKNGEPTVTVELSVLNGKNRKITTLFFNEKDVKINEGQIIIDLFEDKRVKMEVPSCIPTITNPGSQSDFEGDPVALQIEAKSPIDLPLTYSADDDTLPPGLRIDPADGKISGTLLAAGTYVVTVTVSDDGPRTASTAFKWTVKPFRPPIDIITPEDQSNFEGDAVSLQIKAKSASGLPLTYSDDDDTLPPGLSIDPADGKISGTLLAAGTYVVTVTVTDGSDTTSTAFKWTVKPFRPPIDIITPEDQSNFEGDAVSLQIKAKSASGLPLTYSDDDDTLPPGLSIDPADGKISGTLLAAGTYVVTVTVTDGSDTTSTAFKWTVKPFRPPIDIITPEDQSNFEGDAVSLQIKAKSASGLPLTYSDDDDTLPPGLSIDPADGKISGTLLAAGTYVVTVTVTDGSDTASTAFRWTVASPPPPPECKIINPGPQSNFEGDAVALQIVAAGECDSYSAVNLPDGLDIDEDSGLISGIIAAGSSDDSPYGVTVTVVEDESGRTDSTTFTWTVARVVDPGPTIINPGDQRNFEGETVSLQIKAKSVSGLALTYRDVNLPEELEINEVTGLISGTIAEGTSGTYGVTVTVVEDESGRTDSTTFTWTVARVVDPGPTIINPGDQRNFEGDTVSLQIKAKSASGLALTYSADNLPDDLDIKKDTGLIFGTLADGNSGTYGVTVTVVEDESGRTDSTTFTWTVARVVDPGPTIINPGDQRNFEGDTVSLQIKAKSASGLALTYRDVNLPEELEINEVTGLISGTIAEGTSDNSPYGVTVTVVEDESGRTDSTTFTWTVARVVDPGPTIINPGDQRNFEGETVSLQIKAKSVSGLALTYRDVNLPDDLDINEVTGLISGIIAADTSGTYGVTVTVVEDESGRTDSTTFTWTVARVVDPGPTIINPGPQRNFEGDTVSLQIKAKSASGLALTYSAVNLPDDLDINEVTGLIFGTIDADTSGTYGVTVTVDEDESGRTDSTTFTWTVARVVDPGPTIINPRDQRNFEGETVSLQIKAKSASGLALTYSADNLPDDLDIKKDTGLIFGTLADGTSGTYGVTVTVVEDESGRTDSTTFTWTVARVVDPGPTIINPGPQRNFEGDTVSLQIKAKSASGLALTYSAVNLPDDLDINEVTGLIFGTIDADTSGTYGVTVTVVEDESGRTDSTTFTWTVARVVDPGPTIINPGDQRNFEGDTVSLQIKAKSASGLALTYRADNLPDDLDIKKDTGLIFGTLAEGTSGTYGVTVTVVEDESGRTDSTTFTWTVARVVDPGPTIINPGDQRNFEGDTVSLQIKAKSASGLALTYRDVNLPEELEINEVTGLISGTIAEGTSDDSPYGVTVTVVEDESGRTDSTTFTWTVGRCTLEPMEGRIIIQLGPSFLCSPQEGGSCVGQSTSIPVNPLIPSGIYDVTLESFDDHSGQSPPHGQMNESYFLRLRNQNDLKIVDTNAIGDLPDNMDQKTQIVNTDLFVEDAIGSIIAIHFCDDSTGNNCALSPNSIDPVCVSFDLVEEGITDLPMGE